MGRPYQARHDVGDCLCQMVVPSRQVDGELEPYEITRGGGGSEVDIIQTCLNEFVSF